MESGERLKKQLEGMQGADLIIYFYREMSKSSKEEWIF